MQPGTSCTKRLQILLFFSSFGQVTKPLLCTRAGSQWTPCLTMGVGFSVSVFSQREPRENPTRLNIVTLPSLLMGRMDTCGGLSGMAAFLIRGNAQFIWEQGKQHP